MIHQYWLLRIDLCINGGTVSAQRDITTLGFDLVSNSLNHLRAYPYTMHLGKHSVGTFPDEHQRIPSAGLCDIPAW